MSEIIEELSPAPADLVAIFYDEDAGAEPQKGERVVSIARVKTGARHDLVPVVISPEGELELVTEDPDYLGLAWADDLDAIKEMLMAETVKRHPEIQAKVEAKKAKDKKAKKGQPGE